MIDYTEIPDTGELWEAFARDFLVELGFAVESPPDRGADQGKDLLLLEQVTGKLNNYPFRWLVSCKHLAASNRSVTEADEPNLLERLASFNADGFIGFYSTLPSAGLNSRLFSLRREGKIRDYKIFDGKLVENYCVRAGYSKLLMRYCPASYMRIAPLRKVLSEYMPLPCGACGRDLLEALFTDEAPGVIAQVTKAHPNGMTEILDVYWACKGECDQALERAAHARHDAFTGWEDISDLTIPSWYLRWMLSTINQLHAKSHFYSSKALEKERTFLVAMAQKVMRETTDAEMKRVASLISLLDIS